MSISPSVKVDRLKVTDRDLLRSLRWHSRRGMLELDLLLLPFVADVLPRLRLEEVQAYQRLLACEDPQLYACLVRGEAVADRALAAVVQAVRDHACAAPMPSCAQRGSVRC